jgi:hypothetical protein
MTSVLIVQDHSLIVLSQNLMYFPRDGIKIFRWKWKDFIVAGRASKYNCEGHARKSRT